MEAMSSFARGNVHRAVVGDVLRRQSYVGFALNAEILTPLPTVTLFPGLVRLRANVLRQVDDDRYVGEGADSPPVDGLPTYEVHSATATFDDIQHPVTDIFGTPGRPTTGEPAPSKNEQRLTAYNDFLYVEDVPVFYWPYFPTI